MEGEDPMRNHGFHTLPWAVTVWALILGCLPSTGWAGPVPSSIGHLGSTREASIRRIEKMLANKRIVRSLKRRGIKPGELRQKLEKMSDHEVHMLAERLQTTRSGGQVTGILIIILLVILIVYFLDRV